MLIAFAILLLGVAAAFVALPLIRRPSGDETAHAGYGLEALERRDRALAALKELEFDHRTGKVSDGDYVAALPSLRREAADALLGIAEDPR